MGRIHQLPDPLIDQIAAGEVVERPASVVKELVENALDAEAGRIRVEVRDGGSAWICVSDDGLGMSPEDAQLAIRRHATSKIASAEDLTRIHTLGFRGEALPSIASVSRFLLRTRLRGEELGYELRLDAGQICEQGVCGAQPGTRIEVADLFGSIPARRKFLKTPGTEWGHIVDWLSRIALVHPGVHFEIQREDRRAIVWPATEDPLERIAAVLSEDEAAALVPVDGEVAGIRLTGFASAPAFHRSTASGIYLFVNARPVRDRLLRHAVLQIYRDLLPRGRFPSVLLHLEVFSDAVDVNVHPAKWEVRFVEPQSVHQLVRHSLRNSVQDRSYLPVNELDSYVRNPMAYRPSSGRERVAEPETSDWIFSAEPFERNPLDGAGTVEVDAQSLDPIEESTGQGKGPLSPSRVRFADYRLIGQVLATYLVLEAKDAVLLVDQHAAHERVLYERLRARWLDGGVERAALLIPASVELDEARATALAETSEGIAQMGFEIEPFGEDGTVLVRAIPALLEGRDPALLVRSLADELLETSHLGASFSANSRVLDVVDKIFASLACHAARRKGDLLDPREQRALLESLDQIPWAPTCPHGRPVAVPLESSEIERRFARR